MYNIMNIINLFSTWVLASFQSMPCNLALDLPPPPLAITGIAPARLPPKHIKYITPAYIIQSIRRILDIAEKHQHTIY
jgi:hypothetical protein